MRDKPGRLPEVMNLFLKGYTQREIAARVGVSQKTISEDLKELKAEWKEECDRTKANVFQKFLNSYNLVLKEVWEIADNCGDPKYKIAALKLISDLLYKMSDLEGARELGTIDPKTVVEISGLFYDFIKKNPTDSPQYQAFKKEYNDAQNFGFDERKERTEIASSYEEWCQKQENKEGNDEEEIDC